MPTWDTTVGVSPGYTYLSLFIFSKKSTMYFLKDSHKVGVLGEKRKKTCTRAIRVPRRAASRSEEKVTHLKGLMTQECWRAGDPVAWILLEYPDVGIYSNCLRSRVLSPDLTYRSSGLGLEEPLSLP